MTRQHDPGRSWGSQKGCQSPWGTLQIRVSFSATSQVRKEAPPQLVSTAPSQVLGAGQVMASTGWVHDKAAFLICGVSMSSSLGKDQNSTVL